MIKAAASILDVQEGVLEEFLDAQDLYNNNTLTGVLCQQGDHRYGALVIFKVNGVDVPPQRIFATPKLHYPFGKDGIERNYHWPVLQRGRIYEKLDGTNILAYSYADATGKRYVTFKTRLTPTLRVSRFGDFKSMWDRMLVKYPQLRCPAAVLSGEHTFSFEMYGYQNPILVHYDVDLETRMLFVVRQTDAAVEPPEISGLDVAICCPVLHQVGSTAELTHAYEQMRVEAEAKNKPTDDGYIDGTEGFVFYVLDTDSVWHMFKCKPSCIEEMHWATGGISYNSILVTAKNALENIPVDQLDSAFVSKLLEEEFSKEQVALSAQRIDKAIVDVKAYWTRVAMIKDLYSRCPATGTKRDLMRYMSAFFPRDKMKLVFSTMMSLGLIPGDTHA